MTDLAKMPAKPVNEELKPRGLKRVNLETKVNMEFERFSGFISEYSGNISEGGMFVKTNTPQPVGSVFSFEFRLRDAVKLIQGWGEVVWARTPAEAEGGKQAGMGIKFIDLDGDSRNLIRRIVNTEKGVMADNKKGGSGSGSIHDILNDEALFDEQSETADLTDQTSQIFSETLAMPSEELLEEASAVPDAAAGLPEDTDSNLSFAQSPEDDLGETNIIRPEKKIPTMWIVIVAVLAIVGGGGFYFRNHVMNLLGMGGQPTTPAPAAAPVAPEPVRNVPPPAEPVAEAPAVAAAPTEAVAPPIPTPAVAAPAAPEALKLPPAHSIVDVKIAKQEAQESSFVVILDGGVVAEQVTLFPADQPPPRLVLDIPGINKSFPKAAINFKDSRVSRVRFGLHSNPDKMRLVFDLNKGFQGKSELAVDGKKLTVKLSQSK